MENTKSFCPDCQLAAGQAPEPGAEVAWCPTHRAVETVEYLIGEHKELPNIRGEKHERGRKSRGERAARRARLAKIEADLEAIHNAASNKEGK